MSSTSTIRVNPKLVIKSTTSQGRGLFYDPIDSNEASDLTQGSTVFRTSPIVAAISSKMAKTHCSRCFTSQPPAAKDLKRCARCKFARYCSAACQKEDWAEVHQFECKALAVWNEHCKNTTQRLTAQLVAQGASAEDVRLPTLEYPSELVRINAKLFFKKGAFEEKQGGAVAFKELEGHNSQRVKSRSGLQLISEDGLKIGTFLSFLVAGPLPEDPPADLLIQRLKPLGIGDRELFDTLCKHLTNASVVMSPTGDHLGPFHAPILGMLNHSCEPNVCVVTPNALVGPDPIHLVALKDIKPGDQLTITYLDLSMPYEGRAYRLKTDYFFECQCSACSRVRIVHKRIMKVGKAASGRAIDPREALRCEDRTCPGWRDKPATYCTSGSVELSCSQCHAPSTINVAKLNKELDAAEDEIRKATDELTSLKDVEMLRNWESIVKPNFITMLSRCPPSAFPVFPLLHWVKQWLTVIYHKVPKDLRDGSQLGSSSSVLSDAHIGYTCAQLSFLQVSAAKAGGEAIYGKANPNRAWLILGLVKWLLFSGDEQNVNKSQDDLSLLAPDLERITDLNQSSDNLPLLPPLPPLGPERAHWAKELLTEGLETCRLAFGDQAWQEAGGLKDEFRRQLKEVEDWEKQSTGIIQGTA